MRTFFARLTNIPSLAEHIKVDSYLEKTEPFVYISLKEMVFVHKLTVGAYSIACMRCAGPRLLCHRARHEKQSKIRH